MIVVIPLLMDQNIKDLRLASLFIFFSVMIVTSIDEVARELENPFRKIPNELPLVRDLTHII
jgi:predicted membrane chloride channel (bestrophin family)